MRQVGSIDNQQHAHLFADYLVAEGIAAHAEEVTSGDWAIWVRDENQIEPAANRLKQFVQNPADPRYSGVAQRAEEVRRQTTRRRQQARKNLVEMRTQWGRSAVRRAPVVFALIAISVLVTIATGGGLNVEPVRNQLTFSRVEVTPQGTFVPRDYFYHVKQGQVWRLITPIFVHFGLLHLAFNMYMLHALGVQVENRYGTLWIGWLVLVIAVVSNAAQAYLAQVFPSDIVGRGPVFGGMSGVDYGLFGYIWMKMRFDWQSGLYVSQGTIVALLVWFVLCLTPFMTVANGAHAAGLGMGMALGIAPALWRRALRR